MFVRAFLMLVPLGVIGLISEYLWRKKILRGEGGRKFVHILTGVWISLWPHFVSYHIIQALGLLLVGLLLASRFLHIFHAVHDVRRRTIGEFFYPIAITCCALIAPPDWVFTTAILYLAVADGLAAVVGTRYRKAARHYKVLKLDKSVFGTAVFLVSGLVCSLLAFYFFSPDPGFFFADYLPILLMVAVASTFFENILPYGSDNLIIPLFVVLVLP